PAHAQVRPLVAALLDEHGRDEAHHVAGNGEAHAGVGAHAVGVADLRVDADHFATHVQQRPAAVAGVNRRVRLDDLGDAELGRQAGDSPADGADDAQRHTTVEAERVADGDDPFAGPHFVAVA